MKPPPHPYSFTTSHLTALKGRFAALPAAPGEYPAPADVEALCSALATEGAHPTATRGHVATAVYDRAAHRVNVVLHGDMLAFPVEIAMAAPAPVVEREEMAADAEE